MATPNRRRTTARTTRRPHPIKIDPIKLGRLLQRRKAGALVIALLIIFLIGVLDRYAGLLPVDDDWHRYHGQTFDVARVIDGDTLDLRVADGDKPTTRIRLWGVDTAEMNSRDASKGPEPWAQEATDFTRQAAEGQRVTLHLQAHRLRGGFGRVLAYVELPDGTILNAALIEQGLSKHDDRWGHDQAQAYDALEQQARQSRRGMWAP